MSTPAASAASNDAGVLPGAIRSAPLWPTRLSAGIPGTSRSCGCRRPGRARWMRLPAPQRGHGRPARVVDLLVAALAAVARPSCCIRGPHGLDDRQRLLVARPRPVGRHGSIPAAKQPSAFHRLPMPAIVRWSSSASPIGRVGSSSRSRRRKRASSNSGARMSGPRPAMRWSKRVRDVGHQLEHRAVELDDLAAAARGSRARRGAPSAASGAASVARARAGHAQVRVDRQVALEAQEQVLAVRVDRVHRPAGQPLGPAVAAEARVRRARARRARGPRARAGCGSPRSGSCRPRARLKGRRGG